MNGILGGKSFLKKKQPPPEHSTPIREDKPTLLKSSIGGDKPSPIEATESGTKQKSKTKKEVFLSFVLFLRHCRNLQ